MTIIAFDSKSMAADSLCATGTGQNLGKTKKLYRLKSEAILGTAGDEDCRAVIALLDGVKDFEDMPSKAELEATRTEFIGLLWLTNKKLIEVGISSDEDARFFASVREVNERYAAVGHGEEYARAVLSLGKSSREAVKAAIKHSLFCGPPIQEMKLGEVTKPSPKPKNLQQTKPKKKHIEVSEESLIIE